MCLFFDSRKIKGKKQKATPSSSSSSGTEAEDEVETSYHAFTKQRKIDPEMWDDVEEEVVERLPNGIDGLRAFKINNVTDVKSRRAALSSDGRQWKKDTTTTWANKGPMRNADCRGSWKCNNENCIFNTQYGVVNRLQFQKKGVDRTCSACGNKAESVECLARRYTKIGKKTLQVYHIGQHTCPTKSDTGKKQK